MRFRTIVPALLVPLLLSACAGGAERTMGLHLGPDTEAVLLLTGDQPFVTVENGGPGVVEVAWESHPAPGQGIVSSDGMSRIMPGTAAATSIICPSRITVSTGEEGGATVQVIVDRCDDIRLDSPVPVRDR